MSGQVHLVRGDDPTLRDATVDALVDELLGAVDRTLALEEHTVPERRRAGVDAGPPAEVAEAPVFRRLVTALQSPPFMSDRRVVVVREIGNLAADEVAVLVDELGALLDSVVVVLVSGGGRTSQKLTRALGSLGARTHVPAAEEGATGWSKARDVVAKQLSISLQASGVRLAPSATERVAQHVGLDAGRVPELVDLLRAAYGKGATLSVEQVEPYLGDVGTADRFELTNAIDAGDAAAALDTLHRLLHATSGGQARVLHPLQVLATLQHHVADVLRLDDPAVATKEQAAEVLGRSPGAARFRLDAARRLGSAGIREAVALLARADLDLRGGSGAPDETVLEVLVARLAALNRRHGAGARRGSGRARGGRRSGAR